MLAQFFLINLLNDLKVKENQLIVSYYKVSIFSLRTSSLKVNKKL